MFERLLLFGLVSVAMGVGVGSVVLAWQAARGTAHLVQVLRPSRACLGCQQLGRRCPWCAEELHRRVVTALALFLPAIAWPIMVWSSVEFAPRVRLVTAVWALLHVSVVLSRTLHG